MKTASIFITLAFLILSTARSYALPTKWFKIIECNWGELIVDETYIDPGPRRKYQLVLRGRPLQQFIQTGAIDKKYVNNKGEFILDVSSSGYGELTGSALHGKDHNGSYNFHYYVIQKHFDMITLQALRDQNQNYKEITNWAFHGCRYQTSEP